MSAAESLRLGDGRVVDRVGRWQRSREIGCRVNLASEELSGVVPLIAGAVDLQPSLLILRPVSGMRDKLLSERSLLPRFLPPPIPGYQRWTEDLRG